MFFYTIKDNNIHRFSDMFIPHDHGKHSVFFASGLTLTPTDHVLLSYGVSDMLCKAVEFTKDQVTAMLKTEVDDLTFVRVNPPLAVGGRPPYKKSGRKVLVGSSPRCVYTCARKSFVRWDNAYVSMQDIRTRFAVAKL